MPNRSHEGEPTSHDFQSESAKALGKIGPTIHDLFRYGYGGLLALFLGQVAGSDIPGKASQLGVVFTLLTAMAIGAAVYVFARNTIGRWAVLFTEYLHEKWQRGTVQTRAQYFKSDEFKLGIFEAEDAFQVMREHRDDAGSPLWPKELQNQFYRQHSEMHLIYITSFEFMLLAVWFAHTDGLGSKRFWGSLAIAVISSLVGGFADLDISKRECAQLKRNGTKVKSLLREYGIIGLGDASSQKTDASPGT